MKQLTNEAVRAILRVAPEPLSFGELKAILIPCGHRDMDIRQAAWFLARQNKARITNSLAVETTEARPEKHEQIWAIIDVAVVALREQTEQYQHSIGNAIQLIPLLD